MAVRYIPYFPNTLEGQALLDNFTRTRRILSYRDNGAVVQRIQRGMPLYEMQLQERVGSTPDDNLVIRGECVSACACLKDRGIKVDLVYIDPPFASGADYAKKVYLRRNPKVAQAIEQAEEELSSDELRAFEEKMYGDVWDKERYLNWMYENLMAIKAVMSDSASIYVHLDWHIGHYVKILLDEIFGEENFRNEIVWYYDDKFATGGNALDKNHDVIYLYSMSEECTEIPYFIPKGKATRRAKRIKVNGKTVDALDEKGKKIVVEYTEKRIDDVWNIPRTISLSEYVYSTQKPVELLKRVMEHSSHKGDLVADFFGGSGVMAEVAHRLGRKFIHGDVGINSIQTVRERLVEAGASFSVLDVQDGVSLYRNPVQTMEKLKSLITGLRNEDALDKFWEGGIVDTKQGLMPVYLPNLTDGTTRMLDCPLMNRILREAMPDLPAETKRVIVYYIDITDRDEIDRFIDEQNNTGIEVELRDLKQVLDNVVVEDSAAWKVKKGGKDLTEPWEVCIKSFFSDRVQGKIDEFNERGYQQSLQRIARGKEGGFTPITLSEEGLETIEWISLDTSTADKDAPWHSDSEIYIDRHAKVVKNGVKTQEYWDGTIAAGSRPLRMKIRNICGDESVFVL